MTTPTDQRLQLALAKMLPEKLIPAAKAGKYWWNGNPRNRIIGCEILDTEWLHVCWLVEQGLNDKESVEFAKVFCDECEKQFTQEQKRSLSDHTIFYRLLSASWQQRTIALCKVKGVEIV